MASNGDDGFTLVVNQRKKSKNKWKKKLPNQSSQSHNYLPIDMDNETFPDNYQQFKTKLTLRLQKCIHFLKASQFTNQVAKCLSKNGSNTKEVNNLPVEETKDSINCLANNLANCSLNQFDSIVSYGIGKFSSSKDSLYQLALIIVLKTDLILSSDNWLIYDPVFTDDEKAFLTDSGFKLIEINEKGAKSITTKTLFYMPHCPLPMYNNLLWANWLPSKLNQIVLLGTSFNSLVNSFISTDQQTEYSHLINLTQSKLIDEYHLDPPQEIYQSFNDLSVHYFKRVNDEETVLQLMANCDPKSKPIYSDDVFSKEMIVN